MCIRDRTYTLYIDGRSAGLPQNQGRIFETLMTSGGDVVSKEKLCEAVWGTSEPILRLLPLQECLDNNKHAVYKM